MIEYSKKIPELGDVVKVYYRQQKTLYGNFIPNHEFGIIVKIPGNGRILLKQSYEKYELTEVNWFLESSKVRFI